MLRIAVPPLLLMFEVWATPKDDCWWLLHKILLVFVYNLCMFGALFFVGVHCGVGLLETVRLPRWSSRPYILIIFF